MGISRLYRDRKRYARGDFRRETALDLDVPEHLFGEDAGDDDHAQKESENQIKEVVAVVDRHQPDAKRENGENPALAGKMEPPARVEITA